MRRILLVLVAAAIALAGCGDDGQQRSTADGVVVQVGEASVRADARGRPGIASARALGPGEPRRGERHALPAARRLALLLDEGHAVPDRHRLDQGRPGRGRERRRAPAAGPELTASDLLPRPARRPRAGGERRLGRGPRDPPGRRRAGAAAPDRVPCDGAGSEARAEHGLLGCRPSARGGGGGRRGRPARVRLRLGGGGLRVGRSHAAGLVGLEHAERAARHRDHADVRPPAGGGRDGGDHHGPPLGRPVHPRPRRFRPAGGGGLVRHAVRQAARPHTRVREDRARHLRPQGAGDERWPALSAPLPERDRSRQAAEVHGPPGARGHPDLPRRRGPQERRARGGDLRRLAGALLARQLQLLQGRARGGVRAARARGARGTTSRSRRPCR